MSIKLFSFLSFFSVSVNAAWPWSDLADKVLDTAVCNLNASGGNVIEMTNLKGHLVPDSLSYAPFVLTKVSSDFLEIYRRGDRKRLIVKVQKESDKFNLVLKNGYVYFTCYD